MDLIPAESHGMIGQVERGIGVLKERMIKHLRSSEGDPREAAWAMVTAHNGLVWVGGYSPQQWVFLDETSLMQIDYMMDMIYPSGPQ